MKCAVIYLSMTGNTEMIARGVCNGIKSVTGHCDLIKFRDALPTRFGDYDLIGFGTPVLGYQAPNFFQDFVRSFRFLGGKPGFFFCTHGTHGEYFPSRAHALLEEKQMKVLGVRRWYAASFIPGHMNPYPTAGHPDKTDVMEAREWGAELAGMAQKLYAGEAVELPAMPVDPEPPLDEMLANLMRIEDERSGGKFGSNDPHRQFPGENYEKEKCNYPNCRICVDNCPMYGIDMTVDPPVIGDPCCHCMLCAKLCPSGAMSPGFLYTTPGEKTAKYVPEFYTERLEIDEQAGLFRRKVPVDEIGWTTPYYKDYSKRPWFILGKGPNGPKSKYWGEGMAEIEGEIDYGD